VGRENQDGENILLKWKLTKEEERMGTGLIWCRILVLRCTVITSNVSQNEGNMI
jgi:hypothetical protein